MPSSYRLVSIRISPFCELARWALEHLGIAYEESCHAPLLNVPFTLWAGRSVNVPVVQAPDAVLDVQQLLAYLDARAPEEERLYPADPDLNREAKQLVSELVGDLGIAVREYAYANMLPNKRVTAALMTVRAPLWERLLVYGFYPLQALGMRLALGITPSATENARLNILDWIAKLSARIQPGQTYLLGDRLSAADMALATALAPVTLPPEYGAPFPQLQDLPLGMRETVDVVRASPAGQLVLALYREHRKPVYDAMATAPSAGVTASESFKRWLGRLLTNPGLLRIAFAVLRWRPVWRFGETTLITRHVDVVDMLKRDQQFTIAEINAARMDRISGPFILGMDRSPSFDREAAAIRGVVKPGDLDWIRRIVRTNAHQLIAAAQPGGHLDISGGYSRLVAARVVAEYFGVPGPNQHILMQWMRALFWDVFINRNDEATVRRAADRAAVELREYLVALIAARRRSPMGEDLLSRLVAAQVLDDEGVRRNITGIIVGAIDTTTAATTNAMLVMLHQPNALAAARAAAEVGDAELLRQCSYEALRFRPQAAALLRHSNEDVTLASGAQVLAVPNALALTLSAMFDDRAFIEPREFRADRPLGDYLHFGHGMHQCYGRMINGVQIPELIGALVAQPGLARADGPFRSILYEGPFIDRLVVSFGA